MRVIKNVNKIYTGKKTQGISGYEIQNRRVARESAAEGMVLLENHEHILPLQSGSKIALYGSGAVKTIKGGSGSGDVNERETISIWTGMKNAGYEIVNEDWLSEYKCLYEIEKRAWRDRILEITVEDVLTLGDTVKVVCLGKDKMGRFSFSMKDVAE